MTYHWIFNMSNMTGATSGVGTSYSSGALDFNPGFQITHCISFV